MGRLFVEDTCPECKGTGKADDTVEMFGEDSRCQLCKGLRQVLRPATALDIIGSYEDVGDLEILEDAIKDALRPWEEGDESSVYVRLSRRGEERARAGPSSDGDFFWKAQLTPGTRKHLLSGKAASLEDAMAIADDILSRCHVLFEYCEDTRVPDEPPEREEVPCYACRSWDDEEEHFQEQESIRSFWLNSVVEWCSEKCMREAGVLGEPPNNRKE
jgi:hypothetical protein